jgi:hypothetical protein
MKSFVFWDITPYSPLKVNQRFGEEHAATIFSTEVLYLLLASCWFIAWLTLQP